MANEIRYCEICHSAFKVEKWHKTVTCSGPCKTAKRQKTNIEKYGSIEEYNRRTREKRELTNLTKYGVKCNLETQETQDKIKATNFKKYGVAHASQDDTVKSTKKATCISRYGVDSYSKTDEFLSKSSATNLKIHGVENVFMDRDKMKNSYIEKFGVDHPMKLQDVRDKVARTCREKYGSNYPQQLHISDETLHIVDSKDQLESLYLTENKTIETIASSLGVGYTYILNKLNYHNIPVRRKRYSQFELDVVTFLKKIYEGTILINDKTAIGKELDIFMPDLNLAIECNGLYWHSEFAGGRGRQFHIGKTVECAEKGIQLIHIWDSVWRDKSDIVKSRLTSLIGKNTRIYARNCVVKDISNEDARKFMKDHHIQGSINASVKIGLFYNDTLVAAQTYGTARYSNLAEFELLRSASTAGYTIVGGVSKMIKYFINTRQPSNIISYSDKLWNTGDSYRLAGFTHAGSSPPAYHYTKDYVNLENRQKYQKHKLEKILAVYDNKLTANTNMSNNGYDKVWDCGNDVWIYQCS